VYENVPGHVIPSSSASSTTSDTEATKFPRATRRRTSSSASALKQGVYGQRQADVQMIRVKLLPFGGVTPEQLEAFADATEEWAPLNKGHITTRQNFQFHHHPPG